MLKNEIIELAKQSNLMADGEMWFSPNYGNADVHITDLKRFAKLVAAKEREEYAKLCEYYFLRGMASCIQAREKDD